MTNHQVAPYGSWKSPITSDLIVSETVGLGAISIDHEDIYWIEMRFTEAGRYVLTRLTPDRKSEDVTPPPYNVRTRVHEYGGGSYIVSGGIILFSNVSDQRIYRLEPGQEPRSITPAEDMRYADLIFDSNRGRLICVREDHTVGDRDALNTIVSLDLAPADPSQNSGEILVSGYDFYAYPRLSPDGHSLAWTTWNHPNMPWDGTELWVAEISSDGSLTNPRRIAGGLEESIFQPAWSPDGVLYFVSDRTGWWNLYRWHRPRHRLRRGVVSGAACRARAGRTRHLQGGGPGVGTSRNAHLWNHDCRLAGALGLVD